MEFERSLFRVYERGVSSLSFPRARENATSPAALASGPPIVRRCLRATAADWWRAGMWALLAVAVVALVLLVALHVSFVGNGACLERALSEAGFDVREPVADAASFYFANATSSSQNHAKKRRRDLSSLEAEARAPLHFEPLSAPRRKENAPLNQLIHNEDVNEPGRLVGGGKGEIEEDEEEYYSATTSRASRPDAEENMYRGNGPATFAYHESSSPPERKRPLLTDDVIRVRAFRESSSGDFDDYEFSSDPSFLLMSEALRPVHAVRVVNVSLPLACLGWAARRPLFLLGSSPLLDLVGVDEVVVNQFMHGLKAKRGVLRNLNTHETWSWRWEAPAASTTVDDSALSTFVSRVWSNLGSLWRALVVIVMVSSVTALMVRVLITSGVALMFPLFSILRSLRLASALDARVLTMSYPWIGAEVEVVEAMGRSAAPLVRAHVLSVVVTFSLYEASQYAWKHWLFGFKPHPAGLEVWVFGLFMLVEYFMLIYARSALTLRMLPRIVFWEFMLFLLYVFSVPYGFDNVAAAVLWTSVLFWMLYFVLEAEVRALRRGFVSIEHPRALYTALPSPMWPTSLPPMWSIFHELNRVHRVPGSSGAVAGEVDTGAGAADEPDVSSVAMPSLRDVMALLRAAAATAAAVVATTTSSRRTGGGGSAADHPHAHEDDGDVEETRRRPSTTTTTTTTSSSNVILADDAADDAEAHLSRRRQSTANSVGGATSISLGVGSGSSSMSQSMPPSQ